MTGPGRCFVLGFSPSLESAGEGYDRLSLRRRTLFQTFGRELLKTVDKNVHINATYPALPSYRDAADALLEGLNSQSRTEQEIPRPLAYDVIGLRNDVYQTIVAGDGKFNLVFTFPDVMRSLVCGNTALTPEEVEKYLQSGVVVAGFKAARVSASREIRTRSGRLYQTEEIARPELDTLEMLSAHGIY